MSSASDEVKSYFDLLARESNDFSSSDDDDENIDEEQESEHEKILRRKKERKKKRRRSLLTVEKEKMKTLIKKSLHQKSKKNPTKQLVGYQMVIR